MANENKASEITPFTPSEENVVVYRTEDNSIQLQVKLENESVWLTQDQMAQLFDRDRTVIGRHIRSIFLEGELDESLPSIGVHIVGVKVFLYLCRKFRFLKYVIMEKDQFLELLHEQQSSGLSVTILCSAGRI